VPRSGCSSTRQPISTSSGSAGISRCETVCRLPSRGRLRSSTSATHSRAASFISSDGCRESGPNLDPPGGAEPLCAHPRHQQQHQTDEGDEQQRPGHPPPEAVVEGGGATKPTVPIAAHSSWRPSTAKGAPCSAASTNDAEKLITSPTSTSTKVTTVRAAASGSTARGSSAPAGRRCGRPGPVAGRSAVVTAYLLVSGSGTTRWPGRRPPAGPARLPPARRPRSARRARRSSRTGRTRRRRVRAARRPRVVPAWRRAPPPPRSTARGGPRTPARSQTTASSSAAVPISTASCTPASSSASGARSTPFASPPAIQTADPTARSAAVAACTLVAFESSR
jgi:hypothetical protein